MNHLPNFVTVLLFFILVLLECQSKVVNLPLFSRELYKPVQHDSQRLRPVYPGSYHHSIKRAKRNGEGFAERQQHSFAGDAFVAHPQRQPSPVRVGEVQDVIPQYHKEDCPTCNEPYFAQGTHQPTPGFVHYKDFLAQSNGANNGANGGSQSIGYLGEQNSTYTSDLASGVAAHAIAGSQARAWSGHGHQDLYRSGQIGSTVSQGYHPISGQGGSAELQEATNRLTNIFHQLPIQPLSSHNGAGYNPQNSIPAQQRAAHTNAKKPADTVNFNGQTFYRHDESQLSANSHLGHHQLPQSPITSESQFEESLRQQVNSMFGRGNLPGNQLFLPGSIPISGNGASTRVDMNQDSFGAVAVARGGDNSQAQGGATPGGFFKAQAQSEGGSETQVIGDSSIVIGSATALTGPNRSHANVNMSPHEGGLAQAHTVSGDGSITSNVQAGSRDGYAEAKAKGFGGSLSQAQVDFGRSSSTQHGYNNQGFASSHWVGDRKSSHLGTGASIQSGVGYREAPDDDKPSSANVRSPQLPAEQLGHILPAHRHFTPDMVNNITETVHHPHVETQVHSIDITNGHNTPMGYTPYSNGLQGSGAGLAPRESEIEQIGYEPQGSGATGQEVLATTEQPGISGLAPHAAGHFGSPPDPNELPAYPYHGHYDDQFDGDYGRADTDYTDYTNGYDDSHLDYAEQPHYGDFGAYETERPPSQDDQYHSPELMPVTTQAPLLSPRPLPKGPIVSHYPSHVQDPVYIHPSLAIDQQSQPNGQVNTVTTTSPVYTDSPNLLPSAPNGGSINVVTGNSDTSSKVSNVDRTSLYQRPGTPLQPGDKVPGVPGWFVPEGFRGRVVLGHTKPISADSRHVVEGFNAHVSLRPQTNSQGMPVFASVGGPGTSETIPSTEGTRGVHITLSSGQNNVASSTAQSSSSASSYSSGNGASTMASSRASSSAGVGGSRPGMRKVVTYRRTVKMTKPRLVHRPSSSATPDRQWTNGRTSGNGHYGQPQRSNGNGWSSRTSNGSSNGGTRTNGKSWNNGKSSNPLCNYFTVSCKITYSPYQ